MAFCTNCGASVSGAFCVQCGNPVRAAGAQPPAPAPAPPPPGAPSMTPPREAYGMPQAPMPPTPAKSKGLSPIVWVLIIVGGIFVLGAIGLVGGGLFLANRIARHPADTIARLITAANPDTEVVSTDDSARTITIRDKKTGEVVTMSLDDAKNGRLRFSARDGSGKVGVMEFGGGGKVPSWVPLYPGASSQPNFSFRGEGNDEGGEGGNVTFTTSDSASQVIRFYQDKAKEMGMEVHLNGMTDQGGVIVAADEDSKRTLTIAVGGSGGSTTVNVTYAGKR